MWIAKTQRICGFSHMAHIRDYRQVTILGRQVATYIVNNLKATDDVNDALSAVISHHKCDVIVVSQD